MTFVRFGLTSFIQSDQHGSFDPVRLVDWEDTEASAEPPLSASKGNERIMTQRHTGENRRVEGAVFVQTAERTRNELPEHHDPLRRLS